MGFRAKIGNIKSGTAQGKSTDVVIIDFNDIDKKKWPKRDLNGVVMVGHIPFLPGKHVTEIYATSESISTPFASEGAQDAVGFTGTPQFSHPGNPLEILEFITQKTNKELGVAFRIGGCGPSEPYYMVYGCPFNPLRLVVEGQDDKEAVRSLMKFEQAIKSSVLPGMYLGTFTKATSNIVPKDTTIINVEAGDGEYQLLDNTADKIIENLMGATEGGRYTIKGSGGSNLATIETSNTNFLLRDADWQGLAGTTITFVPFNKGAGVFVYIEQSRT